MTQDMAMALLCLVYFFVAVQAAPLHQLEGEALELAGRHGFLTDDYDRLHLIKLSEHLYDSLHPLSTRRIRRRRETQETTNLHVPINGLNYSLSLQHPRPVLHGNAEIIVADGSKSEESYKLPIRSCYLVGDIDDHQGSVSLSYCDRLRGSMVVSDVEYILEPLENGQHLVAERKKRAAFPFHKYDDLMQEESRSFAEEYQGDTLFPDVSDISDDFQSRSKLDDLESYMGSAYGSLEDQPVVVEMAVYTDEDYTDLLDKAKADTVQKKVDYLISKFNGVQYEYTKTKQLQRVVIFQIKKMVFFKTNPDWLKVTNYLGPMLSSLCHWSSAKKPYDISYMITGRSPMSPIGLAYLSGACKSHSRCAVSIGTAWGRYVAIAHEIGHLLGMKHDYETKCKSLPHTKLGLMGGKGTDFSQCSRESFLEAMTRPDKNCLFTQNIPDDEIMPELKGEQSLDDIPSVVSVTHHKYCENLMGPGYRYREKEGMKYSCDRGYYCVQLKEGPDFGLIYREGAQGIVGMYCAPGKVCLKRECLPFTLMTLHKDMVVREGGWGRWSQWTQCSRSCGTGIRYRHRECDNPTPIQYKYCEGNEYRAELCNTKACPSDPSDTNSLIKSRADETCMRLVLANALSHKHNYRGTGRVYGSTGYDDVCDTHCYNDNNSNSRDSILPDGTPCSSPDPEFDVGTQENVYARCFRGKCQVFGCDGKFPAKHFGSDPDCGNSPEIIG